MTPEPSPHAARVLVQALAAAGVRELVVAPGSRSAPFVYALADAARDDRPPGAPEVEVHVRLDERDAAFLALGIAKAAAAEGEPRAVAVVTTSGTAVANLAPAVLEAHHSGTPLLLLTADRPWAARGTGANQTTVQPGLLEPAVRLTLDLLVSHDDGDSRTADGTWGLRETIELAASTATSGDPGPVHVNVAFPEPLVPGPEPWPPVEQAPGAQPTPGVESTPGTESTPGAESASGAAPTSGVEPTPGDQLATGGDSFVARELPGGPLTVVVAGDGAGSAARELAEARGWPLLAEPASGARGGPNAIPAYRLVLDAWPRVGEVRRVVVVGRPTLSRPVARLLARDDVEIVRVQRPSVAWPEAGRDADLLVPEIVPAWFERPSESTHQADWLAAWRRAGEVAVGLVRDVFDSGPSGGRAPARLSGAELADLVARATHGEDVLVIGSSNPVRDLDLVAE